MITANFKAYASYVTDSLHQWDINQVLQVSGLNLTTVPEVHFSNANTERAIPRQATMSTGNIGSAVMSVGVPNSLLQEPLRIYAHIGIYEGDTFKVVELVEIPVIPRKRPADYQIQDADEEIYSFKALENAIANMATKAQVANIVAHNNDTTGNTELVDIRVGADGVTYDSAGAAVREQLEEMDIKAKRARALVEGGTIAGNQLVGAMWVPGYVGEGGAIAEAGQNGEAYTENMIEVIPSNTYTIQYARNHPGNYGWLAVTEYDADGNYILRNTYDENGGGFSKAVTWENNKVFYFVYTVSAATRYLRVSGRTWLFASGATADDAKEALVAAKTIFKLNGEVSYPSYEKATLTAAINPNIKSVNHRGYNSVAPENTLSAFKLSKKMGFDIVEADVSFTADGYAVLLHDTTVDRTSNGTGTIGNLTLASVRSLDFGSWKSADYAGEKIPTFEEFIALCRNIGLHPYIEIKAPASRAQIEGLVATVKLYGMADKVTWITAGGSQYLEYIRAAHAAARIGIVVSAVQESHVQEAVALKNGTNEVFIDAVSEQLTDTMVQACAENNIPLEVWDLWSAEQIVAAHSYISGFTTDILVAGVEMYKATR